jgi:hypothetical protein
VSWVSICAWVALALNLGMITLSGYNILRAQRLQREADAMKAALLAQAEQIIVLDKLLMGLCVQAASNASDPAWRAWCGTLGAIEVNIQGRMNGRPWMADYSLPTGPEDVPGLVRPHVDDHA